MTTRVVSGVRLVARNMIRSPLFSGTAALILAVGIGTATAIFTVVNGILLEPLPLPDSDRVLIVCERHPSLTEYCVGSGPTMHDISRRSESLGSVGLARSWNFNVTDGDRKVLVRSALATPGFFEVLGARPVAGRLLAPDEVGEDASVVLLGHETWTTQFGADPGLVGRTLSLDGPPTS